MRPREKLERAAEVARLKRQKTKLATIKSMSDNWKKEHEMLPTENAHGVPPGCVLVVNRGPYRNSNLEYPRGAEVPLDAVPADRITVLLRTGILVAVPPSSEPRPQPRKRPPLEAAKPKPALVIVADDDPCESLKLTTEALMRVHGNAGVVDDLLHSTKEGRDLLKHAYAVADFRKREAKTALTRRGVEARVNRSHPGVVT